MPYLGSIGTDLGCWGPPQQRVAGDDEDAGTHAGEAGASHTPPTATSVEIDVSFTGIDEIGYEGGFAERVGGHELDEAEVTSVGGALPVKPSGGLKVKGHPPGATGVAQCAELFAQLRWEAVNQVDGARIALARDIGGATAVSAVTILEGPANGAE